MSTTPIIQCVNYDICKNDNKCNKQYVKDTYGSPMCKQCVTKYKSPLKMIQQCLFDEKENAKENIICCNICFLENVELVLQPSCQKHYTCINCFDRCYNGKKEYDNSNITWPYSDESMQMYYYNPMDDDELKLFLDKYPKIKEYEDKIKKYEETAAKLFDDEIYLRCCPECRKKI